jgi:hypothetical protein
MFKRIPNDLILVTFTKKDYTLEQRWMTLKKLEKEFRDKMKC